MALEKFWELFLRNAETLGLFLELEILGSFLMRIEIFRLFWGGGLKFFGLFWDMLENFVLFFLS